MNFLRRTAQTCRFVLALWLILGARPAAAGDLRVFTESLPPFNYVEKGRITGYATELLREMLKEAGLQARFELMPWPRAYELALDQADTILFSTVRNEEREHLFLWIGPIAERRMYVYKLSRRGDIQVKRLTDILPYRVGLVRGMASSQLLNNLLGSDQLKADYSRLQELNVRKLIAGRLDLIVALDYGIDNMLREQHLDPGAIEPILLLDELHPLYFALNPNTNPESVQGLRAAYQKLKASGRMDALKAIYLH